MPLPAPGPVPIQRKPPLTCSRCKKVLGSVGGLEYHQKICGNLKRLTCNHCKRVFRQSGARVNHEKRCLSLIGPADCRYCNKVFKRHGLKNTHEFLCTFRFRSKQGPYPTCRYCNQMFIQRGSRARHEQTCGASQKTNQAVSEKSSILPDEVPVACEPKEAQDE